jgi:hypothetical protein
VIWIARQTLYITLLPECPSPPSRALSQASPNVSQRSGTSSSLRLSVSTPSFCGQVPGTPPALSLKSLLFLVGLALWAGPPDGNLLLRGRVDQNVDLAGTLGKRKEASIFFFAVFEMIGMIQAEKTFFENEKENKKQRKSRELQVLAVIVEQVIRR